MLPFAGALEKVCWASQAGCQAEGLKGNAVVRVGVLPASGVRLASNCRAPRAVTLRGSGRELRGGSFSLLGYITLMYVR